MLYAETTNCSQKHILLPSVLYVPNNTAMLPIIILVFSALALAADAQQKVQNTQILHHHFLNNETIGGFDRGCKHTSQYYVTANIDFPLCIGQTDQDLKNRMSIINLVNSRQYLPTCRVLHLMLWMHSTVHDRNHIPRDLFVDVGFNIGSCAVHGRVGIASGSSGTRATTCWHNSRVYWY